VELQYVYLTGQVFQVSVWVILNYESNLVPAGHQVSIYYLNLSADIPIWQMIQSSVIGPGIVETKTLHFITFEVFSQTGMEVDSGEISERVPLAAHFLLTGNVRICLHSARLQVETSEKGRVKHSTTFLIFIR
jgi:hypothetical protein